MFRKVLIANRGEVAVRIIRACREMGIQTVAVFSEADRDALHVALADEAYCIGEAPVLKSYLNQDAILSVACGTHADAVHPGYGLLSENADFARKCIENGLAWIGPKPEVMDLMSRKDDARALAAKARVPVTQGSGILKNAEEALKAARKIGYPCMLKARSGGGGKGIRIVRNDRELKEAYPEAYEEAVKSFGDGALFLEKYLEHVRHIEVQVAADVKGKVIALGERDCSVQRNHQKLIEESPAPGVDAKLRKKLYEAAKRVTKKAGYVTVGTVEFLVEDDGHFWFCEMNTRLQVEHTVTEMLTGRDLVKMQIRLAAGLPLKEEDYVPEGTASVIECRINAEDSKTGMPSCGTVSLYHAPGGMDIRFDTMLYQGMTVTPYYDSLLGKLIVRGCDRNEAMRKMKSSLGELAVGGIKTNRDMQRAILDAQDFFDGSYHTDFFDKFRQKGK